jgi:squalene-hopene/tetraprenyl-beta-curcumene cyclase
MTLALSGRLGANGWQRVPALPFELAILPSGFFGALRLPVVSYALPALIAIGHTIHHHAPSHNPIIRGLRDVSRNRTLRLLSRIQPANGGFLEATPLTAFVTMSMASAGHRCHPVPQKGAAFLRSSARADGSWPIDTNLATWVTTLAIKALSHEPASTLSRSQTSRLCAWLLHQQTKETHPYTGAAPGAWAWTDLPGGVPDADDTAGALVALHCLGNRDFRTIQAAAAGVSWLLNLQNRDGGVPTFCPGWGTFPFDRSTPEVTAHALRAWTLWRPSLQANLQTRVDRAVRSALHFLEKKQNPDGSFIPLWFGNEHAPHDHNPVYGTAQVLIALNELDSSRIPVPLSLRIKAADFLLDSQHPAGGWGGDSATPETLEETALAVEALSAVPEAARRLPRAVNRFLEMCEASQFQVASPIGLYFARLWYFERLYPLIFSTSALGKLRLAPIDRR